MSQEARWSFLEQREEQLHQPAFPPRPLTSGLALSFPVQAHSISVVPSFQH